MTGPRAVDGGLTFHKQRTRKNSQKETLLLVSAVDDHQLWDSLFFFIHELTDG